MNKVKGLGPVRLRRLLDEYRDPRTICETLNFPVSDIAEELAALQRFKAQAVTIDDENYPSSLKNIHDPPPVLYVKGGLTAGDRQAIAIVGTRKPTRSGVETAERLAGQLAALGLTIVSGLALGIDTAAHRGALLAGGRTIAVLGSGIDQIYPSSNRALAAEIEQHGALVSEFPLGQQPDKWTFPQRNRLISGLSLGVIMVEGHYDSGAMITAKEALDQGREVFAVPGNVLLEQSKGPHWLIKQGAKLVEDVQDVLDELRLPKMANVQCQMTNEGRVYPELNEEEKKVMTCLSLEPKHLDLIAAETKAPVQQISALLMMLEIKKVVRQLPGKMFILG
ncbi:MAG: DNA-processing protein DprA [Candidatus Margulisbacteria bacterium]|nr:DNA-processing protein DprA [Candidatus Margulisiibacteriota bacterium]